MRIVKNLIKTVISLVIFLVIVVVFVGKASWDFTFRGPGENDFSNVIYQGIGDHNPRVIDVAMLGAHDAFSSGINKKSKIDPAEASNSIVRNETVGFFADGMITRLSKAQKANAKTLLQNGVRYFDVRITNVEGVWYTTHALLSHPLKDYLMEIISFLQDHPTEFIVFDMQHVSLGDATYWDLFEYMESIQIAGKSLLSFVSYNTKSTKLADLTYREVTNQLQSAGVVILAKATIDTSHQKHYIYQNSIRSTWHEKNTTKQLLTSIRNEVLYLQTKATIDRDKFRVNQAQMTGLFSVDKIIPTIFGWSLLDMANRFNKTLLKQSDLISWFDVMPILMVDYADSMRGNFNQVINDMIIEYNRAK